MAILVLALSCDDNPTGEKPDPYGNVVITVTVPAAAKPAVVNPTTSASIVFYDDADKEIAHKSLTVADGRVSGTVKVPSGVNYRAVLTCRDSSGGVTHTATADNVAIVAGKSVTLTLTLTPASPETTIASGPETMAEIGTQYSITWEKASRAGSYTVAESSDSGFSSSTTKTVTDLTAAFTHTEVGLYYYRVRAENATGSGPWSNTVTVSVGIIQYSLTVQVTPPGGGSVEPTAGSHQYAKDTVVNLTATPATGYRFIGWAGGVADSTSATTTVAMSGNRTVTANFEEILTPVEINMVTIPMGSFLMGSNNGENNEKPVHTVNIDSFEMSSFEITQNQFSEVMGYNPSWFNDDINLPVETVSRIDAMKFCNALSDKMGYDKCYDSFSWKCDFSKNGYRLPTEAEWEYASRANTNTEYYFGDNVNNLANYAWYVYNRIDNKTQVVGGKEPNAWGLYDMYGNVWEWCNDWYNEEYYKISPEMNPVGPESGTTGVWRGGFWDSDAYSCRSAYRLEKPIGEWTGAIGFRIVRGAFTPGYTISGTITGASDVTVTLSGDASDTQTVSSDGGTYSLSVTQGGSYTVTPSKTGYTFNPTSWTFDNITADQIQNFTASISQSQYTLTMAVNTTGWGTTSPAVGTHTYDSGTSVTVTAFPESGYQFVGWTGGVADSLSANTTVNMDGDRTVTANFEESTIGTDIQMMPIPGGTFQMGDVENYGQNSYEQPVHFTTLSAFEMSIYEITQGQYKSVMGSNPANGYGVGDDYPVYYISWYDAVKFCNNLSDSEGLDRCYNESTWECDFTKNGFRLPTDGEWEYACRAGTETYFNTGNVISGDGQTSTDLDRAGWYDANSGSTTHPVGEKEPNAWGLFDMHGNVWELCNDWYDSYTSESQTNPIGPTSGSLRTMRGGGWFSYAKDCRSAHRSGCLITTTSDYLGFRVVRGAFNPGRIISGTITGASDVTVTLSGDASDTQTVSSDGGSYSFAVSQGGSYTVTPSKSGYTFDPTSKTFDNITSNQSQGFTASRTQYTLTMAVNTTGWGTTSPSVGTKTYDSGTTVTITATPASGYQFESWSGNVNDPSSATTTITMNDDQTVIANFEKTQYALTMEVNTSGWGTTTPAPGGTHICDSDSSVTITATPASGCWFVNWTGDVADAYSTSTKVTMNGDKTVKANFGRYYYLTIAVSNSGGGTISLSAGTHEYVSGSSVTITATPASGYRFVGWTGNVTNASSATTTVMMNSDQTVRANFEKIQYTLTMGVTPAGGGTTTPSVESHTYDSGSSVTITATPASDYRFVSWTGSVADSLSTTTTVTMDGNKTITANFKPDIEMVSIPSGTFRMGDIQNYNVFISEKPVHTVTLTSFEMSIYEVTQGQYQSVMGTNPSGSYGVGDNYPVYDVSWYDAVEFCNKLSDATGLGRCYNESTWACDLTKNGFRLPTEAEWEYACRAGTETYFNTGNVISGDGQTSTDLDRAGWYDANSGFTAHPVGEKEPNAFDLYDMHGNVLEWCNDWYGESYYESSPSTDPTGPSTGSYRVERGGGWGSNAWDCRSAVRIRYNPTFTYSFLGFRIVRRP